MENMREIAVFVGQGLDAKGIKDAPNESDEPGHESTLLFEVAHALLSDHKDDRAEVHSVTVNEAKVDATHPNQVHIDFTTSWTAFYGCRDMNMADDEYECEAATDTNDGHLIFLVPMLRRPASHC